MNGNGNVSIVDSLERTRAALVQILRSTNVIATHLGILETRLGSKHTSSQMDYIPGAARVLVYSMGGKAQGDPIGDSVRKLKGTGKRLPSFILGADRSESPETCQALLHQARGKVADVRAIIGLRWADIPPPLDKYSTVIIGTRFRAIHGEYLAKMMKRFDSAGLEIVEDDGEFGGGPIVYSIVHNLSDTEKITIIELVVDSAFAADADRIARVFQLLADE